MLERKQQQTYTGWMSENTIIQKDLCSGEAMHMWNFVQKHSGRGATWCHEIGLNLLNWRNEVLQTPCLCCILLKYNFSTNKLSQVLYWHISIWSTSTWHVCKGPFRQNMISAVQVTEHNVFQSPVVLLSHLIWETLNMENILYCLMFTMLVLDVSLQHKLQLRLVDILRG